MTVLGNGVGLARIVFARRPSRLKRHTGRNQGEHPQDGKFFTVTFTRSYKDVEGNWKEGQIRRGKPP